MPIGLKVSSNGALTKRLQERAEAWSQARLGAKLVVSDESKWWYWQEFGTASQGDAGGSSYTIDPVNATELRFPAGGKMQYKAQVHHPGVKPRRSVTKALPDVNALLGSAVHEAFESGALDDPGILQDALMTVMTEGKALIVQSIADNVPGVRALEPEQGRLGGMTAAEAFDADANVVDVETG